MKSIQQAGLLGLLCVLPLISLAIKPVADNFYMNVFLGPSATTNLTFVFNPSTIPQSTIDKFKSSFQQTFGITLPELNLALPNQNIPGQLTYSILGGVGGEIGYQVVPQYHMGIEFLYNNNPFKQLTLGNYTLTNNESDPLYIEGDTNAFLGFFNAYYDMLIPSRDNYSTLSPYAGIGAGYFFRENTLKLNYSTTYEKVFKQNTGALAVQGILGLSYFMDDFCKIFVDVRYVTTAKKTGAFPDAGITYSLRPQLIFVAFGFQGILNHAT